MVLPGHLAGGYLAAGGLLALFHPDLSQGHIISLIIIGILAGELPDIDLFFFNIAERHKNKTSPSENQSGSHRNYITHIPLFWIITSLLVSGIGFGFGSAFVGYSGLMILAGTMSHFIFDSIEYGIRWLAPFSGVYYSFRKKIPAEHITARPGSIASYAQFVVGTYWKTWTFWIEIIVTIFALCILLAHGL
jgi:hypothetical protein